MEGDGMVVAEASDRINVEGVNRVIGSGSEATSE
jgi:hypothetical protein